MLLINWLYYEKTLLNFEDIVFLSGKTGEGKSALIDAMQIIILGKTDNSLFNKSANDKTTRDLMGYLKGKYKNGTFKREKGTFSSHLCMEFQDDKGQAYSFGIVFDCSGSTRGEMNYRFYMMNQPIPQHQFVEEETLFGKGKHVYDVHKMKEFLDSFQDRSCRMFTTNTDYRSYFKQRMLIKDERFFDVFKMAVAYTPMMNISEFIVKNICHEEEDLNLEEMQEEIQDYRQMKEQLEAVKQKKEQLSLIHEQYDDVIYQLGRETDLMIEQAAADYQSLVLEHHKVQTRYDQTIEKRKALKTQMEEADTSYHALEVELEKLKDLRKDNAADMIERQIQEHQHTWDIHHHDVEAVQKQLVSKGTYLKQLLDHLEDIEDEPEIALEEYDVSARSLEVKRSMNQSSELASFQMNQYLTLKEHLGGIDERLSLSRVSLYTDIEQSRGLLQDLQEKQQKLEHGKKPYPQKLLTLQRELKAQLSALHGKEIDVTILADHINIKDERYRNAIEGYIHNQKLNLIVDEAYFMDAYRIYKSLKNRMNIHTYSIVDHARAKPGKRNDAKTLFDCVEVDQEALVPYVEFLLSRAVCCEEEADLREYPVSITPDCMLYSGYAVNHMNPEYFKVPFIGSDSVEKQLAEVIRQISECKEALVKKEALYQAIKDINLKQSLNEDFIRQLEDGIAKATILQDIEKQIVELRKSQSQESLLELMRIDEKIKETDAERKRVHQLQVKLGSQHNDVEKDLFQTNERMQSLHELLQQRTIPEQGIPERILAITSYEDMLTAKSKIDKELNELKSRISIAQVELISKKRHYTDTFHIHLSLDFHSDEFEREFEKYADNVVEDYIEKCRLAESKAYECFQNNFFSAINSKIDNVKTQIDRLNRSIKRHQFGRSQYEFVCSCNEDYREYYDLITNKELNGHNLLNTHVYEENEELIHELFDKISALSSMQDPKLYHELEKEVRMLSRFTTYLKFDILENGNSLRATIGSSSGGETQTPFYVAVLVSLFSVYDGPAGGLQLAIFDEAFDKMDNERIEECINLLKSLGFQAIIVTPTDKISNLSKSADMTLIAATDEKNGHRVSGIQQWAQRENTYGEAQQSNS